MIRSGICLLLLAIIIAGCGGGSGFTCNLDAATTIASTDWPVERLDAANTARFETTVPLGSAVSAACIFPTATGSGARTFAETSDNCDDSGRAITTTPIVGNGRLFVATTGGTLHVLGLDGTEIELDDPILLGDAINTPLLGADESIFVTSATGATRRFSGATGEQLFSASLLDNIETPPNLGPNGILYAGSISGLFAGVCTNGAFRFTSTLGSVTTAAAVVVNPDNSERNIVVTASGNGRVQAYDDRDGDIMWSFFASGPIQRSAVVVDESRRLFVVADTRGFVFAGSLTTGQMRDQQGNDLVPFQVRRCVPSGAICDSDSDCGEGSCKGERITAAPALGSNRIYVATEGADNVSGQPTSGAIHALSLAFDGREPEWSWLLPEGGTFLSSPALIVDEDTDTEVVIIGADVDVCQGSEPASDCVCDGDGCDTDIRGQVLAISEGAVLWSVDLADAVGTSSPSIREIENGLAVYIGTAGGKLYEIDWRSS